MTTHKNLQLNLSLWSAACLKKSPSPTWSMWVHTWIDPQPTWGFTSVFRQNLTCVNNNMYMWDVFSHIPHMQKVLQLPGSTIRPLCRKCPHLCKFTSNYTKPHEKFKFEFSTWMSQHLLSPTSYWWFYIEFSIYYEFYSFSVIF